jgi:epoxyqueuosine reductase QueG
MKKDHASLEHNIFQTNYLCSGISMEIATYLEMKDIPSSPVSANINYRKDTPFGGLDMLPYLSHRYLAARSGVGYFGMSGNIITKEAGAAVLLGSVVTTAELSPTDPLPEEDNYCDKCGLCMSACSSGFIDFREKSQVTMGDVTFTYSKRRDYNRCNFVCGGFTGLHPSGKWSTWSPGRFPIPEKDEDFMPALLKVMPLYNSRTQRKGGAHHPYLEAKLGITCTYCQLVCTPDKEERKKRFKMISNSGVVLQKPDGTLEAVSPESAKERLAAMRPEVRKLYEDV